MVVAECAVVEEWVEWPRHQPTKPVKSAGGQLCAVVGQDRQRIRRPRFGWPFAPLGAAAEAASASCPQTLESGGRPSGVWSTAPARLGIAGCIVRNTRATLKADRVLMRTNTLRERTPTWLPSNPIGRSSEPERMTRRCVDNRRTLARSVTASRGEVPLTDRALGTRRASYGSVKFVHVGLPGQAPTRPCDEPVHDPFDVAYRSNI